MNDKKKIKQKQKQIKIKIYCIYRAEQEQGKTKNYLFTQRI